MSTTSVGTERDPGMARGEAVYCLECDIVKLRHERKQIQGALKVLFELLEEYAPSWYREEHQKIAVDAFPGICDPNR
jgi:hypothetical protein